MDYVKLYTTIHDDPDMRRLSAPTFREYIYSWSWCGRHETDGVYDVMAGLVGAKAIRELVERGKFIPLDDDHYLINGWSKRQLSSDEIARRRAAGKAAADARWNAGRNASRIANRMQVASRPPNAKVEEQVKVEEQDIAPRKRDALFESVAEACGIDWEHLTPTARGSLNKAVAQIRGADGTPEDVRIRAANWPYDVPLTPPGLAKHWPSLTKPHTRSAGKARSVSNILALADGLENR